MSGPETTFIGAVHKHLPPSPERKQRKWAAPTDDGTYASWKSMKGRCLSKSNVAYKYYGGRGITICEEWQTSFDQFYADVGARPLRLTLDRTDTNLGYMPGNCRWVTMKEQLNNRRNNKIVSHDGKTLTLSQWAEKLDVPYYMIWNRIVAHKMSPEKALTSKSLDRVAAEHGSTTSYARGCRCDECKTGRRAVYFAKKGVVRGTKA